MKTMLAATQAWTGLILLALTGCAGDQLQILNCEDVLLELGDAPGECFVKHRDCPWHRWHGDLGLLSEDRPGCDRWFQATIRTINEKLGTSLRFETLSALPEGGDCCLRRIWEEK